jgi:hypothetical protein
MECGSGHGFHGSYRRPGVAILAILVRRFERFLGLRCVVANIAFVSRFLDVGGVVEFDPAHGIALKNHNIWCFLLSLESCRHS